MRGEHVAHHHATIARGPRKSQSGEDRGHALLGLRPFGRWVRHHGLADLAVIPDPESRDDLRRWYTTGRHFGEVRVNHPAHHAVLDDPSYLLAPIRARRQWRQVGH